MATATKKKPRFKNLETAEARIRLLEKRFKELEDICTRIKQEAKTEKEKNLLLAKLAAKGPAFFSPIEAATAETVRDHILQEHGMNPDGSWIQLAH